MLKVVYDTFGLTYKMALSTRPEEKLGDDAMWDQAEGALQGALDETGLEWEVSPSHPFTFAKYTMRSEKNRLCQSGVVLGASVPRSNPGLPFICRHTCTLLGVCLHH